MEGEVVGVSASIRSRPASCIDWRSNQTIARCSQNRSGTKIKRGRSPGGAGLLVEDRPGSPTSAGRAFADDERSYGEHRLLGPP